MRDSYEYEVYRRVLLINKLKIPFRQHRQKKILTGGMNIASFGTHVLSPKITKFKLEHVHFFANKLF